MALISPGIQVSVTDESQYAPTAVGTIPMLVIASAQDKKSGTGSGTAAGTTKANAEKTYLIGSQRELVSTFGEPTFYKSNSGTPLHGNELNEYGLMAAYSLLGVSNRAYVTRADVDLGQLTASSSRPTGKPANGTYWFDTSKTLFGIQVWNESTQKFSNVVPKVITDSNDIDSSVPKSSYGNVGDYAIDATNTQNPLFYKRLNNTWVQVGTSAWQKAFPTIKGTASSPTLTNGHSIVINGETVTLSGTTLSALATAITNKGIPGVSGAVVNNKLEIIADNTATSDSSNTGVVVLANGTGSILTDAGLTAGTYYAPILTIAPHTSVPEFRSTDTNPRPSGSMWIKTTTPNLGASFSLSKYNSTTGLFESLSAPLYQNDNLAGEGLDKAGNGLNIAEGAVYVQYDPAENNRAGFRFYVRHAKGATKATGTANPSMTAGHAFTISVSQANGTMSTAQTVTLTGTTAETFVSDVNALAISKLTATRDAKTNAITLQHDDGGIIKINVTNGTPFGDAGFSNTMDTVKDGATASEFIISNWKTFTYTAGTTQPTSAPANGTMWYNGVFTDADIMIHNGTAWVGYKTVTSDARGFNLSNTDPKGPIISASEPTAQTDATALVYGDLWINTSDIDTYPKIYRWESVDSEDKWVLIDNTDQTTEAGVLFADFRYHDSGTDDVTTSDVTPITTLQSSNYLDIDAPSSALYPKGMLGFNLRRSSGNVKQYKKNYFNATDYPEDTLPTEKNAWVTVSGLKNDGSPYMGRFAQRNVIVSAMKSVLDTSSELREEQRNFNVLAVPGYPELIQNMVKLNNERRNTGFIVGDTPFRLAPNSTDVQNWATNTKLAVDNNEDGLVTADTYLGVFYPAGRTTDLDGNGIVVPPSHMILRTLIRSDEASFPWFAPAGTRRGGVDNATALGYIDKAEGEFKTVGIRESLRDTLYENKVNPISFFPGQGILNFGNKTRHASASALDRINVARLVAYVRERLGEITKPFVFEPNDKLTRDEVKGVVESLMNDLVAKRGLFDYLVVCDETNNTADRIDRNELYIDVAIEPVKAVEFIYIPIRIQNTGSISGV